MTGDSLILLIIPWNWPKLVEVLGKVLVLVDSVPTSMLERGKLLLETLNLAQMTIAMRCFQRLVLMCWGWPSRSRGGVPRWEA